MGLNSKTLLNDMNVEDLLHKVKEKLGPWVMPQLRVAKGTTGGAGAPRTLNERATERAFHPGN
ncbi:MAG: hypothetical protein DMG05_17395 [Acidobacteria bacterium]|nr:MAG: hypothetical protein DMG05_17395 [Acidobacteriota bacterium]